MKSAIVTSSTQGIGKEIGLKLLSKGYFVIFNYYNSEIHKYELEEYLREKEFKNYKIIKADLTSYEGLELFIKEVNSQYLKIDCLVLNTGMTCRKKFDEIKYEDWQKVMDTNINIPFFLVQKLKNIIEANGRIIFIGSMLGIIPHAVSIPYGVSKGAVHILTKYLAKEFSVNGITVNAIAPGFIDTSWHQNKSYEQRNRIENKIELNRFGIPSEISSIVKLIIENHYVNGTIIQVDGGYDMR